MKARKRRPIRTISPALRSLFTHYDSQYDRTYMELAQEVGIHDRQISGYRSGQQMPNIVMVERIAEKVGCRLRLVKVKDMPILGGRPPKKNPIGAPSPIVAQLVNVADSLNMNGRDFDSTGAVNRGSFTRYRRGENSPTVFRAEEIAWVLGHEIVVEVISKEGQSSDGTFSTINTKEGNIQTVSRALPNRRHDLRAWASWVRRSNSRIYKHVRQPLRAA